MGLKCCALGGLIAGGIGVGGRRVGVWAILAGGVIELCGACLALEEAPL